MPEANPAAPTRAEPFAAEPGRIGQCKVGRTLALAPMTAEAATILGAGLAAIDPWARAGYAPERLTASLARNEADVARYRILAAGALAGVMVVRRTWLHGPYLQLLGLLPAYHGQRIGEAALSWLEAEAQGRQRNLWLCCSSYNTNARRFYEAHGFQVTAVVDGLVFDGLDELLMRKRLRP